MSSLQYAGKAPDSDFSIAPKRYADDQFDAVAVTQAYVDSKVAEQIPLLATKTYVDQQDALMPKKTAVDSADNGYQLATALGANSGLAKYDANLLIPASMIPTGLPGTTVKCITGTRFQPNDYVTTSTGSTGTLAGTVTVPANQGWPFLILPFASMRGYSTTGAFGHMTVRETTTPLNLGHGFCNSTPNESQFVCVPTRGVGLAPFVYPADNAALSVNLYANVYSGTNYTFLKNEFVYYVLIVPAF